MPNHCRNEISVYGAREDVEAFVSKIELAFEEFGTPDFDGDKFTFAAFVPPEKNVLHGSSGYGAFVRRDGVWENIDVNEKEAIRQGIEFYSGEFCRDENGVVYTRPEMNELGLTDWYSWQVDNWGTKWDAYDVSMGYGVDGKSFHIDFFTAWSPPIPVVKAMQEQHPELVITMNYEELGMGFHGFMSEDGVVTDEDFVFYDDEDEEVFS